jgi:hypothetical protein
VSPLCHKEIGVQTGSSDYMLSHSLIPCTLQKYIILIKMMFKTTEAYNTLEAVECAQVISEIEDDFTSLGLKALWLVVKHMQVIISKVLHS